MVAVVAEEPESFVVGSIGDADVDELNAKTVGDVLEGMVVVPGHRRNQRPLGRTEAGAKGHVRKLVDDDGGLGLAMEAFEDDLDPAGKVLWAEPSSEIVRADGKRHQVRTLEDGLRNLLRQHVGGGRHAGAAIQKASGGILVTKTIEEPRDVVPGWAAGAQAVDGAVAQSYIRQRRTRVAGE